ncbi:MAG: hypothetical protein ABL985_19275 [Casimicrobium sp.]
MAHEDTLLQYGEPGGEASDHRESLDRHLVQITLDSVHRQVEKGKYIVSALKTKLGVPADYELDEVHIPEFRALADDSEIKVKGGEVFVSHTRRGGSS